MRVDKRGTILITSLWIIAIISILAIGIGLRVSLELRLSKYNMDRLKALYLAKAGIIKSQDLLSIDGNIYDSIYECGMTLMADQTPEAVFGAPTNRLGEGSFSVYYKNKIESGEVRRYGMADEERRVNINTAAKEILLKLPGITDEIASSVMDWRDPDDVPLANGAENNYYRSLEHPYDCKNGNFSAVEELLLVRGMDQALFKGLRDYITTYGDGKFNVNTAPREVLIAFGMRDLLADKIVDFRKGLDRLEGTEDDNIFININIEEALPDLTTDETAMIGNLKNSFTIASNYFRIESKGSIDRSRIEKAIYCIAKRESGGNATLVYYREY